MGKLWNAGGLLLRFAFDILRWYLTRYVDKRFAYVDFNAFRQEDK